MGKGAADFISDINRAQRNLSFLKKDMQSRRMMNRLARLARSIIYKRVKAGKGARGTLAPLKASTIEIRKGNGVIRGIKVKGKGKKQPRFFPGIDGRPSKTGEFFSPSRSNLTSSGQLLDSIDHKLLRQGKNGFSLFIPNTRREEYKNHDYYNTKPPPTNQDLAIYLQKGRKSKFKMRARRFFILTKGEQRIIIKEYNDILKRIIRKRGF